MAESSKATPGPRLVERCNDEFGEIYYAVHSAYEYDFIANFENKGDATLDAAAPDLLRAWTMGVEMNTPDFLDWIAARLVCKGDDPNVDFVLSLRERAAAGRAAIDKATGEPVDDTDTGQTTWSA